MRVLLGLVISVWVVAGACSPIREDLPTQPEPEPLALGPLIPPAPDPSPTPSPEVAPLPADPGGGDGSAAGGFNGSCGEPTPPSITRVKVTALNPQATQRVLDATPLIGPNGAYCRLIGYTDKRLYCAVRPEGHPERLPCEALQVGLAADTGRTGPTWTANGHPCVGRGPGASCDNHPDNQFLVIAYGAGSFRACIAGGICKTYVVP